MKFAVIGGTGTLGEALIRELIKNEANEVLCVSRCELKQKNLRDALKAPSNLTFRLGDIRDRRRIASLLAGCDAVFLTAALKHVDTLEENPEEAFKTNVQGVLNVADAAIDNKIRYVAFCSTDKAVEPLNSYGFSKALAEKILLQKNQEQDITRFAVFRWGNVTGSRGSIIPIFIKTLKGEGKAYITHPQMTRFWVPIEQATRFMLDNYIFSGLHVMPSKSAPVVQVVERLVYLLNLPYAFQEFVGMRPGEKLHEKLMPDFSSEACTMTDSELDALLKPIIEASA